MKKKVLTTLPLSEEVRSYLSEHHLALTEWEPREGREALYHKISDVQGLITSGLIIDAKLLDHAQKLTIVSNISVGYDNFHIDAMRNKGVIGTNTSGALDDTVADLVVGLMLATARRIASLDQLIRGGRWVKRMDQQELFGLDVHHRTIGIIGMGRIGQVVAKRVVHGFDMKLLYYNRQRNNEIEERFGAQYCSLNELMAQADFVVVLAPLTEETRHMIGEDQFTRMKPSGIFINASRGQVVQEQALIEALRSGRIYGAGLDVFEQEPLPEDSPLLRMPNVVMTPHIGSATSSTRHQMAMLAAKNLVAGLSGDKPPNLLKEFK